MRVVFLVALTFLIQACTTEITPPSRPAPYDPSSVQNCPEAIRVAQAVYPARAWRNGLEGWVVVSFDLNGTGIPVNIEVEDAEPAEIFSEEAIEAASKYRYEEGVIVSGCKYILTFTLEDD